MLSRLAVASCFLTRATVPRIFRRLVICDNEAFEGDLGELPELSPSLYGKMKMIVIPHIPCQQKVENWQKRHLLYISASATPLSSFTQ